VKKVKLVESTFRSKTTREEGTPDEVEVERMKASGSEMDGSDWASLNQEVN
jgi:hypothetical protein